MIGIDAQRRAMVATTLRWCASRARLRTIASCGLAACLLLATPTAHARGALEVGGFVGVHNFHATNELGQPEGLSVGLGSNVTGGLRFGLQLLPIVTAEIEALFASVSVPLTEGATVLGGSGTYWSARGQLRAGWPLGRFEPFVLAGVGVQHVAPDGQTGSQAAQDRATDTDAMSVLGGGVQIRIVGDLHFRTDVRVVVGGSTVDDSTFAGDLETVAGLTWRFGGPDPRSDDSDNDGIPDAADACPFEAETVNGVRDDDGCPEDPVVAKRYHTTRYVREGQRGVIAKLPREAMPRERSVLAAPPPAPPTLPAATTPTQRTPDIDSLEPAMPLADNALPPLTSPGDDDGDGLDRDDDVCPAQAEDVDGFEDSDGCPDDDNDQDGVPDATDLCPFEPETINGVRDDDGCPEDPVIAQRQHKTRYVQLKDSSSVVAVVPARLAAAGAKQGAGAKPGASARPGDSATGKAGPAELEFAKILDEAGPLAPGALPPLVSAGDDDGDGLDRDQDVCPAEPEDADGFEDDDGCPDPDDDRDSVLDAADRCPREGETLNGYEDDDGCPDEVPMPLLKRVGRIEGLVFANNSAQLLPGSEPTLQKVLIILQSFPNIRVELAGHTDDRGTREGNLTLSQQRADAVKTWLVDHGAQITKLTAVGYGPDKPVAKNTTEAGRAKNRRVEFVLIPGDQESAAKLKDADAGPDANPAETTPAPAPAPQRPKEQ